MAQRPDQLFGHTGLLFLSTVLCWRTPVLCYLA